MKNSKLEKVNKMYDNIDFSQLIKDLYTIEGFTQQTIGQAVKCQHKDISIHYNSVFYRKVEEPLIKRLKEANLIEVKPIGGTKFYTILDRQKAIELFKAPEKKRATEITLPDRTFTPAPTVVSKETEVKVKEPNSAEEDSLQFNKESLDKAFMLGPLRLYGFKKRLIGMISIFGCMYRTKQQQVKSSNPKQIWTKYYGSSKGSAIEGIIAEFNTAVRSLGLQFIIKKFGETKMRRYQIDFSPRKGLKFLEKVGDIYFPEDKEIKLFMDWGRNKIEDPGIRQVEQPKEEIEERPKVSSSKEARKITPVVKETSQEHDNIFKVWVVSSMDLSEFMERYNLEATELMHSDSRNLFEAKISSLEVLNRIKNELRQGEKLSEIK